MYRFACADYLVTKCGVLMMSLFVFFTTTMSVSFTLRETQTRMLKFTGRNCLFIIQRSHCVKTDLVIPACVESILSFCPLPHVLIACFKFT